MQTLDRPFLMNRRTVDDRRSRPAAGYSGVEKRRGDDRRSLTDQRRCPRYKVKDVIFTRLVSENDEGLGEVIDIGRGGIAVRYFVKSEATEEYSSMDIFLSSDNFLINGIPIRKVSDVELPNRTPFSVVVMRRFGFEFEKLTDRQSRQLDYYIRHHTRGSA